MLEKDSKGRTRVPDRPPGPPKKEDSKVRSGKYTSAHFRMFVTVFHVFSAKEWTELSHRTGGEEIDITVEKRKRSGCEERECKQPNNFYGTQKLYAVSLLIS